MSGIDISWKRATALRIQFSSAITSDDNRWLHARAYDYVDREFQLKNRQTLASQLEVQLVMPVAHDDFSYAQPRLRYRRVDVVSGYSTQSFDARADLMTLPDTSTQLALNLDRHDRNAHYCFDVRLQVNHTSGGQFDVQRLFITTDRIHSIGLAYGAAEAGFQPATTVDTHYNSHNDDNTDRRTAFGRALDAHFALHYAVQNEVVDVRIDTPPKVVLRLEPDIQRFTIEDIRYQLVSRRDDCNRRLFTEETTWQQGARANFELPIPSLDRTYCLRVKLKGDIRFNFDIHPYRIFYLD